MEGMVNTVSLLKLRVGWGQTGNSEGIGPYRSIALYGTKGTYYDGGVGDFVPGYGIVQNTNPNLQWEVLQQFNVGLDFEILDGKIQGTIEAYDKKTSEMLFNYTVPADGVKYFTNTITANVGEMSNKGLELSLGSTIVQNNSFAWNTRVIGSINKNRVGSLSDEELSVGVIRYNPFGGRGLSDVFASQMKEGHPLGEFLIPGFAGFDTNGNVTLVAADGGSPTTDYTKAQLYEKGSAQPKVTLAWVNTFQYGNFDLNFQLRGVFGNKIMNNLRSNLAIPGSILETNMLNEVADYPTNYSTNQLSDLWIESASFVRMDNWQLGYNIPTKSATITGARIFIAGNNLFIITKYKGIDPELDVKGDLQEEGRSQKPADMGMDNSNIYPKTRSFQLGVNLTF
jgi:iron complex outermembrane receptor protein